MLDLSIYSDVVTSCADPYKDIVNYLAFFYLTAGLVDGLGAKIQFRVEKAKSCQIKSNLKMRPNNNGVVDMETRQDVFGKLDQNHKMYWMMIYNDIGNRD